VTSAAPETFAQDLEVPAATGTSYVAFRVEGRLLSHDLIERIISGDPALPGNRSEDYHLAAGERIGEAASRSWEYLLGAYRGFRDRLDALPADDAGTTLTRERWLLVLLNQLGFGRVPFVRGGLDADGRSFPVTHMWEHVPVHLLGWHDKLDQRNTAKGRAPQSMLQEFLNISDAHLWAIVSNGRLLRILRDATSLTGSAYLEFDLEAIFEGELYYDFYLLYAFCHESRFELLQRDDGAAPTPADCWLERWRTLGIETGERARDQLRTGVKNALGELGIGFLEANPSLRSQLSKGELSKEDFHHELLRLAYQLIFLFVAEDRGLLLRSDAPAAGAARYRDYFSTARLRRIARRRIGDTHADLWRTMVTILNGLGSDEGLPALGLPPLGGLYFRAGTPNGTGRTPQPDLLRDRGLRNYRLLGAIRQLDVVRDRKGRVQRVDYQHLGAEELGSVYEWLLEDIPQCEPAAARFYLEPKPGNERKSTGSYFTPPSLVEELLNTTLQPLIEQAAVSGVPDDLLKITVCDPACGSGHFLVAAARRIARKYAAMVYGDDEPPPEVVRAAMNTVVARCVYGVDVRPLAAELAKVSLWLESLQPGRPLAFLDSHIRVGNSLLGVTPALLEKGLPDTAFTALQGDDKKIVTQVRRRNAQERGGLDHGGQEALFMGAALEVSNAELTPQARAISALHVRSLSDVREQARRFRELENSPELRLRKRVADAWCAAFIWPHASGGPDPITTGTLRSLQSSGHLAEDTEKELAQLTERYQFFHWYLEFPDVFRVEDDARPDHNPDTGWQGGFTCVIGNPPWERVKLQEQEFFADKRPEIAQAANAAKRKKKIEELDRGDEVDQALYRSFRFAQRESSGESCLLRDSGRYPLTGVGDINTYAAFAETGTRLIAPTGRTGLILPTGIATDATTAAFFAHIVENQQLSSLLDFVTNPKIWQAVGHGRQRFSLMTTTGRSALNSRIEIWTYAKVPTDLPPHDQRVHVTSRDLFLTNPNTGTAALFRSRRDVEILSGIYSRLPVLWRDNPEDNPWNVSFMRMYDMATDSRLFRKHDELESDEWSPIGNIFVKEGKRMVPLYEGKMVHYFDHRFGCYSKRLAGSHDTELPRLELSEKCNPYQPVFPLNWVADFTVRRPERSPGKRERFDRGVADRLVSRGWRSGWLVGWRDICRSSDERTIIACLVPRVGVGDKFLLILTEKPVWLLQANLSAFVLDYCARLKFAGTSFKYYLMKQLPVLPPVRYNENPPWAPDCVLSSWVESRVRELSYTAWDIEPFALDLHDEGPPFVWDEQRRFVMRAEMDAAYFHLYGTSRADTDYILTTFDTLQRNDPARFARTRTLILQIYDQMAEAIATGIPYRTMLDPPPGHGLRHPDDRTRSPR
jgi:N-6 DNA Methylase